MKVFDPPLKVGDRILTTPIGAIDLTVSWLGGNWAKGTYKGYNRSLYPEEEGLTWHRVVPLAVGDEVVIIERRTGIVKEINGDTALVTARNWGQSGREHHVLIELSHEGREWERKKE